MTYDELRQRRNRRADLENRCGKRAAIIYVPYLKEEVQLMPTREEKIENFFVEYGFEPSENFLNNNSHLMPNSQPCREDVEKFMRALDDDRI